MLGAYGNSWIKTRHFDRLASRSFLFDQAVIDSPELARLYRAYWLGLHAAVPSASATGPSLPQLLTEAGLRTVLLTDDPEVAGLDLSSAFAERIVIESTDDETAASEVADTHFARLLAAAEQWLQTATEPFALWIHARAMAGPWDAPYELRAAFAEEDDPEPPEFTAVPNRQLPADCDPDELLGIVHAYAGQIAAFDACLGQFVEAFEHSSSAATTLLSLLSARGYPLGEHQRVGACDDALYNELVQFVWLLRFPDAREMLARSQILAQPADLPGTLLESLGLDRGRLGTGQASSLLSHIDGAGQLPRDRALIVSSGGERALRTPAWHLRQSEDGEVELFARPGDRWQVNEVGRLCPEVLDNLQAALATTAALEASQQPLPALDAALVTEFD